MQKNNSGKFRTKRVYFSQVSNHALRDPELSLKAKGLYSLIQSYITIENFVLYKNHLMKQCKEGKTSFNSTWNELKDRGYMKQYKMRDSENGYFYYEYDLLDEPEPCTENGGVGPGAGFEPLDDAGTGKPRSAKGGSYKKTESTNTLNKNIDFIQSVKKTEGPTDFNNLKTLIEEQVDIETLQQEGQDPDFLEELILNICDMHEADFVMVAGSKLPQARVRANIARLKHYHLEHVIRQYNETSVTTPIRNVKGYLQTCIYNSVLESTAKINNEIRAKGLVGY